MLNHWGSALGNSSRNRGKNETGVSSSSVSQSTAKRTLIKGSWVVGYDGQEHRLIDDGVVVYEDDLVIHVGKSYDGKADEVIEAKGRLVIPGLINIHAVSNIDIVHFTIDGARSGPPTNKAEMLEGIANPRYYFETEEDLRTSSRFAIASLLKGGSTTIGEITAFGSTGLHPPRAQAEIIAETVAEMGARAYLSHPYLNGLKYTDDERDPLSLRRGGGSQRARRRRPLL